MDDFFQPFKLCLYADALCLSQQFSAKSGQFTVFVGCTSTKAKREKNVLRVTRHYLN